MADWGVKTSREGLDVTSAADSQLLFSSSWPTLKIEAQGLVSVTHNADKVLYTHNLGYVPMFWFYQKSGTTSKFGMVNGTIEANSTELKYFNTGGGGSADYYFYIFRQPISTDFTAEVTANTLQGPGDTNRDYGIKVTKDGYDITNTDLRKFVVHSGTLTPNIHTVKYGVTAGNTSDYFGSGAAQLKIGHDLGYQPLAFFYVNPGANNVANHSGYYYLQTADTAGTAYLRAFVTSTTARIEEDYTAVGGTAGTATGSIILLKEPFTVQTEQGSSYQKIYI